MAKAGENGVIAIARFDGERTRLIVGYTGEDGIKPGCWYKLDEKGKFVEIEDRPKCESNLN